MNRYRYIRPKPLLAKPFEWIMRGSYHTHLWLDGNSEWYVLNSNELDEIIIDFYKSGWAKEMAAEQEKIGAKK